MLACEQVSKWYDDSQVLTSVDLNVNLGEIHALVGENGAGKSTLAKIVAGLVPLDQGCVKIAGRVVIGSSVSVMQAAGVMLVHQEPRLFPDLTVLENIWIDESPSGRFRRGIDLRELRDRTRHLLAELGCHAPLDARVSDLSVADQQMVDVAAAIRRDRRILIVDESTASLTPAEVENLFAVLRRLRDDGVAIVFIGHRLEEILEISDRITVLRDGRVVASLRTEDTNQNELIALMVGREIETFERTAPTGRGPIVLEVDGLSSAGAFEDVSLRVRAGEILGIGGLVGAGRSELLETIFGLRSRIDGSVTLAGHPIRCTGDAIRARIGLVPEDRGTNGLFLERSIRENIVAANLPFTSVRGIRRRGQERTLSRRMIDAFRIKTASDQESVMQLSGGNQQKVSVAKWLSRDLALLLVDEPTRGVDVGSKSEIHSLLRELVNGGLAVVMVSSDMRELLSMSDRVLVVHEGRVTGELSGSALTEESVLRLATRAVA